MNPSTPPLRSHPPITLPAAASDGNSPVPPMATPGLVALPGTGRLVWWTGRVAIGLRYQRAGNAPAAASSSAAWLQSVLLRAPRGSRRAGNAA